MAKKRVAVICGASVVTCTLIGDKLKRLFEEEKKTRHQPRLRPAVL